MRELFGEVTDVLGRRASLTGEVNQHEPLDDGEVDRVQAHAACVKVVEVVGERRICQRAVEAIRPGVVGAAKAANLAFRLVNDLCAAVAAAVDEGSGQGVIVGNDEHARWPNLRRDVLAALTQLAEMADADPAGLEEVLLLPIENRRIGECSAGQHRCLREARAGALNVGCCEGEGHFGHLSDSSVTRLTSDKVALQAADYKVRNSDPSPSLLPFTSERPSSGWPSRSAQYWPSAPAQRRGPRMLPTPGIRGRRR